MPPLNFLPISDYSWPQIRTFFSFVRKKLREERLPQVAGSLTFTSTFALVPILTIALAIFTTFPLFNTLRASLHLYFVENLMPLSMANTIFSHLNQFAEKASRLSIVGVIVLISTATIMMATIGQAFNRIWSVQASRPWKQRLLVYWATMTFGPLLIGLSIKVTSYIFMSANNTVAHLPLIGTIFYTFISIVLTTGAFTLLYIVVPNRKIDWRDAAWGGLLAACAFEVVKRLFALFIAKFPTYLLVYGALAAIPVFLLWMYVSWLITLIGAVFVASLPIIKYERWQHIESPGSIFGDALLVLNILYQARILNSSSIVTISEMRIQTKFGLEELNILLGKMAHNGWVGQVRSPTSQSYFWPTRVSQQENAWVLLIHPQKLMISDIYQLFVLDLSNQPIIVQKIGSDIHSVLNQSLENYFNTIQ